MKTKWLILALLAIFSFTLEACSGCSSGIDGATSGNSSTGSGAGGSQEPILSDQERAASLTTFGTFSLMSDVALFTDLGSEFQGISTLHLSGSTSSLTGSQTHAKTKKTSDSGFDCGSATLLSDRSVEITCACAGGGSYHVTMTGESSGDPADVWVVPTHECDDSSEPKYIRNINNVTVTKKYLNCIVNDCGINLLINGDDSGIATFNGNDCEDDVDFDVRYHTAGFENPTAAACTDSSVTGLTVTILDSDLNPAKNSSGEVETINVDYDFVITPKTAEGSPFDISMSICIDATYTPIASFPDLVTYVTEAAAATGSSDSTVETAFDQCQLILSTGDDQDTVNLAYCTESGNTNTTILATDTTGDIPLCTALGAAVDFAFPKSLDVSGVSAVLIVLYDYGTDSSFSGNPISFTPDAFEVLDTADLIINGILKGELSDGQLVPGHYYKVVLVAAVPFEDGSTVAKDHSYYFQAQ